MEGFMKTSPEHRKSKRFDHKATVMLEDGAMIKNFTLYSRYMK
jgi:hypothetical protein